MDYGFAFALAVPGNCSSTPPTSDRDWATLDAWTAPDYLGVGVDGSYVDRATMLAGLQDEKLTVLPPDLGEIQVLMIITHG